ncbi:MAG: HAD-IA family hydrolase [Candidatus Lokiarchaeota archaeon]|nr:HAD-IA family hydrolase [Candidatus Lokiarchaeota archaeon]MBD3201434.1 HAD-IA family hydrolase [Candidatus Lokiarchaeota archaeon]
MEDGIAFVFDLDGTLINSTEIGDKIEKEIYKKFNIEIDESTEKEIEELTFEIVQGENRRNLGRELMWAIFKKLGLNFFQRLQALYISAKIFKRENKQVDLYDGVREMFNFLDSKGYPYAIATTSSRGEAKDRLSKFSDVFKKLEGKIITRSDVENLKPDPESIQKASEIMKVPLNKIVMVGDMHSDILMGKNVNAYTIAVLTGIFSREMFEVYNPDLILDSVAKIPQNIEIIKQKIANS